MRILRYVVIAVLAVGLVVTSIGWYLSAHPGGERFESCHWEGDARSCWATPTAPATP